MDLLEMVEKLRQKANVTYEEARAALEQANWDMLDALVLLESEGKVNAQSADNDYSTKEKITVSTEKTGGEDFRSGARKAWQFLRRLFRKGNENSFVITRRGEELIAMPINVLLLLLCWLWPASIIVLIVGLFLGCRYAFRGPDMGARVNEMMDKAADAAQSAKDHAE